MALKKVSGKPRKQLQKSKKIVALKFKPPSRTRSAAGGSSNAKPSNAKKRIAATVKAKAVSKHKKVAPTAKAGKSAAKPLTPSRKTAAAKNGRGQVPALATRRVSLVRRAASAPGRDGKISSAGGRNRIHLNGSKPAPAELPVEKLKKSDIEYFRGLLLEKRRELIGDMGSMESEAFRSEGGHSSSPIHMADVGTDNFEQEFTLGLLESERQTLREIHEAIERLDNGTFGVCVATGKPIGRARLEAKPWAKYCIEYARQLERGHVARDLEASADAADDSDEEDE